MGVIGAIIFIGAAGFAFAVAITVIVIIGIHKEERYLTLEHKTAPGAIAQLARIILGRYIRRERNSALDGCHEPRDKSPIGTAGPKG